MNSNETQIKEQTVFRKIGNTMYEIVIKESNNARESAEDVLSRFITAEATAEVNYD